MSVHTLRGGAPAVAPQHAHPPATVRSVDGPVVLGVHRRRQSRVWRRTAPARAGSACGCLPPLPTMPDRRPARRSTLTAPRCGIPRADRSPWSRRPVRWRRRHDPGPASMRLVVGPRTSLRSSVRPVPNRHTATGHARPGAGVRVLPAARHSGTPLVGLHKAPILAETRSRAGHGPVPIHRHTPWAADGDDSAAASACSRNTGRRRRIARVGVGALRRELQPVRVRRPRAGAVLPPLRNPRRPHRQARPAHRTGPGRAPRCWHRPPPTAPALADQPPRGPRAARLPTPPPLPPAAPAPRTACAA